MVAARRKPDDLVIDKNEETDLDSEDPDGLVIDKNEEPDLDSEDTDT